MTKAQDRIKKKAWDEINKLRQHYRAGIGNEEELVSEITRLSGLCDYGMKHNLLLFFGDDEALYWGFGCYAKEAETGKNTRQLLMEKERGDANATSS